MIDRCDAHASERKVCVLYLSHIASFGFSRFAGVNERSADRAHRQTVAAVLPAAEMLQKHKNQINVQFISLNTENAEESELTGSVLSRFSQNCDQTFQ